MSKIGVPGESSPVVGGVVVNKEVKTIFGKVVQSLIKGGDRKGNYVSSDNTPKCGKCNKPYSPDCDICLGNVFL